MRDLLRAKMEPLVEAFADDLTDLLAERMAREFGRIEESLAVALSTIASTLEQTDIAVLVASEPEPGKLEVNQVQKPTPDPVEQILGLPAGTFPQPKPVANRDIKPDNASDPYTMPASAVARVLGVTAERIYQLDDQLKPKITPSKRGNRSFRAYNPALVDAYLEQRRGEAAAKRSPDWRDRNPPLKPTADALARRQRLDPTPTRSAGAVDAAREQRLERIGRVSSKAPPRSGKPPELGMRARPAPPEPAHLPALEADDEMERWPASRIADETRRAEDSKRQGDLPVPRSSFVL